MDAASTRTNEWAGRREGLVMGLVAIAVGAIVRFVGLGRPTLWLDECVADWIVQAPDWLEFWRRCSDCSATPPLFFAIDRLVATFVGRSELALRLPAATCDLAALVAGALVTARLVGGRAGGYAALAYALQPTLVYHARMARPYGLAMLLATLLAGAGLRAHAHPRRWSGWIAFALSATLLTYAQFAFAPLVVVVAGWLFWSASARRTLASLFVIAAACLPLGPQILRLWEDRASLAWGGTTVDAGRFAEFLQPGAFVVAAFVGVLLGVGLSRSGKWSPAQASGLALLLGWMTAPMLVTFVVATAVSPTLWETRYLLVAAGPACGLLGWAADAVRPIWLRVTVVLAYLAMTPAPAQIRELAAQGYATLVTYDFRPSLDRLSEAGSPDDLVLFRSILIETSLADARRDDPRFQAYLSAPISTFYVKPKLRTLVLAPNARGPALASAILPALEATRARGGDVWLAAQDPFASGAMLVDRADRLLRSAGWTPTERQALAGCWLARYQPPAPAASKERDVPRTGSTDEK